MIDYDELVGRLDKVRRHPGYATARCPAHPDHNPSLSVRQMDDGIAVKCFAGCETDAIARAVGIDTTDLHPDDDNEPKILDQYPYVGPDGELLFEVLRMVPKSFRQRKPDGNGGWEWKLGNVQKVPYRLPELRDAIEVGRWVFLVEGEKDVHRLEREGLVATTTPGGAGAWRDDYAQWFTGGLVAICGDNDPQGEEYAAKAAESVSRTAKEVRVVRLPDLKSKGDISDWLYNHTKDDLEERVRTTPAWKEGGEVPHVDLGDESVTLTWPGIDVRALVDRLAWGGGSVHGEVSVYWSGRTLIEYQRVNCQSASARSGLVTELNRYDKSIEWPAMLTKLFGEAVRHYRTAGRLIDMRERAKAEPPTFLVGDMWPDMTRPSLIFGDSESAKSTIALALLLSIASGRTLISGAEPYRTGPVAFLDWEDDAELFDYRLQTMAASAGIDLTQCHPIHYHHAETALHQIVDSLSGQLKAQGVIAAVIDARSAAQSGSLNDDDGTTQLFDAMRILGCRTMLIDHLDKGSTKEGRTQKHSFGSVFVRGRVVSSWFAKANHSTATQKIVTFHDAKWNHGPTRPTRTFIIDWAEGVRIDRRADVWIDPEPGSEPTGQRQRALEYVEANPAGVKTGAVANHLEVESRQASAVLAALVNKKHIQKVADLWLPLNDPY